VDDAFYQGFFNFQITIIDFIIRNYAAKRHEQGLSSDRIFTVMTIRRVFFAMFAMPQNGALSSCSGYRKGATAVPDHQKKY
jgi:hypothetical protein